MCGCGRAWAWYYRLDHGYHLGHLRLSPGKQHFYEFDARVPMLLRGPGLHAGATPPLVAGNVDLAPTFLWLAGVGVPSRMDGRPVIAQLLEHTLPRPHEETGTRAQTPTSALWRTSYLVEHSGLHGWAKNTRASLHGCAVSASFSCQKRAWYARVAHRDSTRRIT